MGWIRVPSGTFNNAMDIVPDLGGNGPIAGVDYVASKAENAARVRDPQGFRQSQQQAMAQRLGIAPSQTPNQGAAGADPLRPLVPRVGRY